MQAHTAHTAHSHIHTYMHAHTHANTSTHITHTIPTDWMMAHCDKIVLRLNRCIAPPIKTCDTAPAYPISGHDANLEFVFTSDDMHCVNFLVMQC